MHRRLCAAIVAGALAGAALVALAVLAQRPQRGPSAPPRTPEAARAALVPSVEARWDLPASASAELLREISARESYRALGALVDCERRAAARAPAARSPGFRHCALRVIARAGGFAGTNRRMLDQLMADHHPRPRCAAALRALAGGSGAVDMLAHTTLRSWAAASWPEVRASSRSLRGVSRAALRAARWPGWQRACRPARSPSARLTA